MPYETCPLPTPSGHDEQVVIERILGASRIAVVGASDDPARAGHYVPQYMARQGKQIIPVNPNHAEVLGVRCVKSLSDIKGPVDAVLVFRRPEFCAAVADEAVRIGAKAIWLQSGIRSEEARCIAGQAGVDFVQDRCMMVEHMQRRTP